MIAQVDCGNGRPMAEVCYGRVLAVCHWWESSRYVLTVREFKVCAIFGNTLFMY